MPKKLAKSSTFSSLTSTTSSGSLGPPNTLPSFLTDGQPLPALIVFDLDYTLWPFWVDTHVYPPIKPNAAHTQCTDKIGETFSFYVDIPGILTALSLAGIKIGVASRTYAPDLGREMLKQLHLPSASTLFPGGMAAGGGAEEQPKKKDKDAGKTRRSLELFDGGLEIYPGSKIRHLEALAKKTGIPCTDTLFFDDESRNREVESLGVTMSLVRDGVTWAELERGIVEWRRRRARAREGSLGAVVPPTQRRGSAY